MQRFRVLTVYNAKNRIEMCNWLIRKPVCQRIGYKKDTYFVYFMHTELKILNLLRISYKKRGRLC